MNIMGHPLTGQRSKKINVDQRALDLNMKNMLLFHQKPKIRKIFCMAIEVIF